MADKNFQVVMKVFSFTEKAEALRFADRLTDALCDIPEAKDYAASAEVVELVEEDHSDG